MRVVAANRKQPADPCCALPAKNLSRWTVTVCVLFAIAAFGVAGAVAQDADREARLVSRFVSVLKRNPREGTAFDRVYEFHRNNGTLDEFVAEMTSAAKTEGADGSDWMIVGLCELRSGHRQRAIDAFAQARQQRPDDPLAAWYLGRSHLEAGGYPSAVLALEQAVNLKPTRIDRQSVYQLLATAYQRIQEPEKAIGVYERLETEFPEDTQIRQQIAALLADQGLHAEALKRFQALTAAAKDPSERIQFATSCAELELKLGHLRPAVERLEAILADLKPGSWRHEDVRRRIEDAYLNNGDADGLVAYYEDRLKRHPADIDAMRRLSRLLLQSQNTEAALQWIETAIERSPEDLSVRESLAELMVRMQRYREAAGQYEYLAEAVPDKAEYVENRGRALLLDSELSAAERRQTVSALWQRFAERVADDPVALSRVADWCVDSDMAEDAVTHYQAAIKLAPAEWAYREALGEFLHRQGRDVEAIQAVKGIVAGGGRTVGNLVSLAETLQRWGQHDQALDAMDEACRLAPEFHNLIAYSRMLRTSGRVDDAILQVLEAKSLTTREAELQTAVDELIVCYQASGQLRQRTDELEARLANSDEATSDQWQLLAALYEAGGRQSAALGAATRAVKAGDDSTAALKLSARLAESAGLLSEAAGSYRLLADQDARGRFEHLKSLANLQLRLGQVDKAIAAGQELVGLAAGNALSHRFLADLYFRTGQTQQAIDSLKSAVRIDGSNADTLIALAQALADRYETDAAIETLWQAFDAANAIDQKISITHTLAVLYQRSGRVEELTARLQRPPRETAEAVLQAQCLAAVYQAVDDIAMARRVLKRLLTNDRQDISVLRQLITLAEQQKDFVEAAELQARVNVIDPSPEGLQRYISLILQLPTESRPVLSLSDRQFSTLPKDAQYELVDTLVDSGELIAARRMGHSLLQQNADDRRVLLSLAVAAWKAKDADAAAESLNRILALPAQGSENLPQAVGSTGANGQQASATEEVPRVARIADRIQHVASLLGLSPGSDPLQRRLRSLGVESAEEIRLVALVARTMLAAELKNTDEYLAGLRLQADDAAAKDDGAGMDGQRVWDLYVAMSTLHGIGQATLGDIAAAAARLAELPDSDAQFAYLDSTHSQAWFEESAPNNRPARGNAPQPLQSQQIDRLLNAWKIVYQQRPDWLHEHHHVAVARECDFAARTDDTTAMLASLGRETASVTETKAVLSILARRQSVGEFVQLVRRLSQSISNGTAGAATGDLDSGLIAEDVSRLMAAVARKGEVAEWADVIREFIRLRAVELEFTAVERENLLQPESRSSVRELVVYGADGTFGRRRFGGIPADGVLGDEHLGVLATTFQALRSEGRGEQLLSVLQDLTDDSADAVRLVSQAAMAQVYSFQADTDNAALHLVRAADAWPDAVAVRLYLARFYQQSGNPREALRLLDTVKVTNPAAYLQRELLALDIAGDTGDVARARQAAGYLANLQLDANDQKVLADRMKKLGLSDAAGRVAMRTELQQHVAALDPSDRLKQFVEAGDQAAATEVARQLLYSALSRTISSSDRRQAIVILKEAGVLDAFVEDIQQKLKRNPDSLACLELLQECLDAVGDSDVAEKIRLQIANLMPVDIDQMLQVAHQLEQRGQAEQACDRYLEIARLDPTCLAVDYYRVIRTFRNARRLSELSEAMLEQDLSGLAPNAYAIQELVEQQMADSSQSAGEVGRRLFSKAWQELPMIRENLLSNISDDGIWKLPVMYDFLRAEVLPDSPSELRAYPWMKFTGSPELLPDGRMDATVCRLIRSAMQRDRCRELKVQIEAAVQTSPEWHGGHLLLAVIEGRTGEGANAKQRLAVMLSDDDVVKSLPGDVAWSVASCLVDDQLVPVDRSLLPEISRLLEIAVSATRDNAGQWGGYQRNPVQLLARLLSNAKDIQKARQVIVRHMDQGIVGLTEPGIRWPDVRMDDLVTAAQQILDAGFPVESIGLLNQITPELLSDARQRKSDARSLQDQLRNVRSRATAAITLDAIALHLSEVEGPQADSELAGRGRVAVLDFLLTVAEVEDLPRRVVSPVEKCLLSSPAETRLAGRVQSLARERIGYDPTPASAMALMGFGSGNRTQIEEALKLLDGYVAVQSSRSDTGRSEADMAIWLVARQALQSGESVAERLAEYATMSAKAMGCNDVMAAILRERGDTAVAVGNRKLAEQLRAQLLQAVLGHPDGTSPQSAALKELRQRLLDDDATGQP